MEPLTNYTRYMNFKNRILRLIYFGDTFYGYFPSRYFYTQKTNIFVVFFSSPPASRLCKPTATAVFSLVINHSTKLAKHGRLRGR